MATWCACEQKMVEPSMCGGCDLADDEITDDELEAAEAEMNCGRIAGQGGCTMAGTEWCDWDCPYSASAPHNRRWLKPKPLPLFDESPNSNTVTGVP